MPDPTLRPCPFCGGDAKLLAYRVAEDAMEARVECQTCSAQSAASEDAYAPTDEAVTAWNTRAADAEIERLRAALTQAYDTALKAAEKALDDRDRLLAEFDGDPIGVIDNMLGALAGLRDGALANSDTGGRDDRPPQT